MICFDDPVVNFVKRRGREDASGDPVPRRRRSPLRVTAVAGVALLVLAGVIGFLVWQNESFGSTDGGHVAVVRNGGPFDNTRIRQVLPRPRGAPTSACTRRCTTIRPVSGSTRSAVPARRPTPTSR